MTILRSTVWGPTRRSTRRYFWRGRGSIPLMLILALCCAYSSQAQDEEPYPTTTSPTLRPPTNEPTKNPSYRPISSPQEEEVLRIEPTASPTSNPTAEPTLMSTVEPMPKPTLAPVYAPTTIFAPTGEARTEPPTVSDLPVQRLATPVFEMIIGGIILPLRNTEENIIEELTSDSIAGYIIDVLGADRIDSLSVDVSIISPVSRKLRGRPRHLAETHFMLHVEILMQSLIETHDVDRYIFGAFNDDIENTMFIEALKATEATAFANVDSLSVAPLADDITSQGRGENLGGETTNENSVDYLAIVVPIVVVVVSAAIGIAAFFVFKGRIRSKVRATAEKSHRIGSSLQSEASDAGIEIQIRNNMDGDISTLGDSIPPTIPKNEVVGTPNVLEKIKDGSSYDDESLKKTGIDALKRNKCPLLESIMTTDDSSFDDFDFQKSFCGGDYTSSMVDTMSSKPTISLVSNDDNLDTGVFLEDGTDCFEIEAPPGLLGLLLVDSDQGVPAVHMIKSSSPLTGQVQKGDRLVGVDGKNVSLMWATDVSRLVAKKKNKTKRLLFSRPLENQFEASGIEPKKSNLLRRSLFTGPLPIDIEDESDAEKEYVA